uniref:Uncharacterized protein n=1 Tax=Anguilla anguilla TaxID=7936 RepID=A0A0E9WSX4_ANGAN
MKIFKCRMWLEFTSAWQFEQCPTGIQYIRYRYSNHLMNKIIILRQIFTNALVCT